VLVGGGVEGVVPDSLFNEFPLNTSVILGSDSVGLDELSEESDGRDIGVFVHKIF
jgi:hypothetical protein